MCQDGQEVSESDGGIGAWGGKDFYYRFVIFSRSELTSSSDSETYRCCYRGMCGDYGKMGKKDGEGV